MNPPWTNCLDCGRKLNVPDVCRCPDCLRNYNAAYNDPKNKERRQRRFDELANEFKPQRKEKK